MTVTDEVDKTTTAISERVILHAVWGLILVVETIALKFLVTSVGAAVVDLATVISQ